jgi:predicted  nucleic acid-binding Zn-ribbon protein
MDPVCHRCGTALNSPDELFCPHCGAPQLRYEPTEEPATAVATPQTAGRNFDLYSSKRAILSALMVSAAVAVPISLLSSIYDSIFFWAVGAGIVTVVVYHRRVGIAPTGRLGWRIGCLTGLLTASFSLALYSARSVIQRYLLHSDDPQQLARALAQQVAAAMSEAGRSNPQAAEAAAQFARFWLSPDGPAAIVLVEAAKFTFSLVLFAAAGGVIGARIAALGKRPERSSQ